MDAVSTHRIASWHVEARRLEAKTARLLAPIYTPRTIAHEQQTRFGVHLRYLEAELARRGSAPRPRLPRQGGKHAA